MARQSFDYNSFVAAHGVSLTEIAGEHTRALGTTIIDRIRGVTGGSVQELGVEDNGWEAKQITDSTEVKLFGRLAATTSNGRQLMQESGDDIGLALYAEISGSEDPARVSLKSISGWRKHLDPETKMLIHAMLDQRTATQARQAATPGSVEKVLAGFVYPNVSCVQAGRAIGCMLDIVRLEPFLPDGGAYAGGWLPPTADGKT